MFLTNFNFVYYGMKTSVMWCEWWMKFIKQIKNAVLMTNLSLKSLIKKYFLQFSLPSGQKAGSNASVNAIQKKDNQLSINWADF